MRPGRSLSLTHILSSSPSASGSRAQRLLSPGLPRASGKAAPRRAAPRTAHAPRKPRPHPAARRDVTEPARAPRVEATDRAARRSAGSAGGGSPAPSGPASRASPVCVGSGGGGSKAGGGAWRSVSRRPAARRAWPPCRRATHSTRRLEGGGHMARERLGTGTCGFPSTPNASQDKQRVLQTMLSPVSCATQFGRFIFFQF